MKIYKLMLKQHNVTGLKYLCITSKQNPYKYKGSGHYWLKHLSEYGDDITTIILEETDNKEELAEYGKYYSKLFNVVSDKCFANLIEEHGYCWPEHPFEHMDKDLYEETMKRKSESLKKTWDSKQIEERELIAEKIKKNWREKSSEEKKAFSDSVRKIWQQEGRKEEMSRIQKHIWEERSHDIEYMKRFKENCRNAQNKMTEEEKKERSKKISEGRLNMSEEAKAIRKQKILDGRKNKMDVYQESYRKMSEDRKGSGNPMAKRVEYKGVIYSKKEFETQFGKFEEYENDPQFKKLFTEQTEYQTLTCPYCGKTCNGYPNAFLRWHMDNCKHKPKEEKQ